MIRHRHHWLVRLAMRTHLFFVEQVRIGSNTTDYVRISFKR